MLGCASILAAVSELMKDEAIREFSIPVAIGAIVVGVLFVILGKLVSANKEKKAQTAQAPRAATAAPNAGYAQPQHTVANATQKANTSSAILSQTDTKPLKRSATTAGVFFLLAFVLDFCASNMYGSLSPSYRLDFSMALCFVMCLLLAVACFRTRFTQDVSSLHIIGFLGLIFSNVNTAMNHYNHYGFGGYTSDNGIYYALISVPLIKIAAFLVILLLAFFAMEKARERLGGAVRVLWLIPSLLLLLVFTKEVSDSQALDMLQTMLKKHAFAIRPQYLDMLSRLCIVLGTFFTGLAFRRICQKPVVSFQPSATPIYEQPQYTAYAPPVQPSAMQPQPEPVRTATTPPESSIRQEAAAAVQADPQDLEKKVQAYRDLLECGILTQEEYDQEIRKMMRG
ncbi:MAG: hypothetical protein E7319_11180 [Clostridiales bacterium]|nr:hypothetical protein [Clostridiales bacterium]